ncbi:aldo/keto reductase [Lactobacillaceae bacterium Melli_B4]
MRYTTLGNSDDQYSVIGAGLMGLSPNVYGSVTEADGIKIIQEAKSLGINYFDTADAYGNGYNEELLGKALGKDRHDVFIASKVGYGKDWHFIGNDPKYIKQAVDASLKRLNTDYLDLYYIHLIDPQVPIEESIGALADLIKDGKVRHIGLSDGTTPDLLKRANQVHPISALQKEYNLWTQDSAPLFKVAKELKITPVSFCPLSRGILSGKIRQFDDLPENDNRRHMERYQPEVLPYNLKIIDKLSSIANRLGISLAQLDLAWIISKGVIPIPGTKKLNYLHDNANAADIELSADVIEEIDQLTNQYQLKGKGGNP